MERGTTEGHGSQRRSEGIRPGPRWRNSFWAEGTLHPRAPGKEVRMDKVINALTSSICLYYTLPHFTKDLRSFYSEVDRLTGDWKLRSPPEKGGGLLSSWSGRQVPHREKNRGVSMGLEETGKGLGMRRDRDHWMDLAQL